MSSKALYQTLASSLNALSNCIASGNAYAATHESNLETLVSEFMPSGSGIDSGTKLDLDESLRHKGARLVFTTAFHHMNQDGYYDGWTEHKVIVTPSLQFGFDLKITGRDRNDIKEYLHEVYHHALTQIIRYDETGFSLVREPSKSDLHGVANP